jgi:hypothetical protein
MPGQILRSQLIGNWVLTRSSLGQIPIGYQSAFAAMSSAIVLLENREMVERYVPQRFGHDRFEVSPAGRAALAKRSRQVTERAK